ncbi:MAG: dCTP deaminase [Candidatus Aenigmatarchaeota archaeon]
MPTTLLPDFKLLKYITIEPNTDSLKDINVISYGLSSYGYDIRLGKTFMFLDYTSYLYDKNHNTDTDKHQDCPCLDPKNRSQLEKYFKKVICCDYYLLTGHSFVLAESMETVHVPRNALGLCLGKSSYARCGVVLNTTPLEPGWCGKITLEIANVTPLPVKLYVGEGIAQLLFFMNDSSDECKVSYNDRKGKYNNQEGIVLSIVKEG